MTRDLDETTSEGRRVTALGLDLDAKISAAMDEQRWDDAQALCSGLEHEYRLQGMTAILTEYLRDVQLRLDRENAAHAEAVTAAVRQRDTEAARRLLDDKRDFHRTWHDSYIDFMAVIQSHLVTTFSEAELADALHAVGMAMRPMFDQMNVDFDTRVSRFAAAMRGHLGQLEVYEDDEKFTFVSDPCGSGGRLLREGAYEGEHALALMREPRDITLNRVDFPSYCTHCPSWMSQLHEDAYGSPNVVVPPKEPGDVCVTHIYKAPEDVPVDFRRAIGRVR